MLYKDVGTVFQLESAVLDIVLDMVDAAASEGDVLIMVPSPLHPVPSPLHPVPSPLHPVPSPLDPE
eukprot:4797110-Pyramimonas_sp.AAC.2